MITYNYLGKEQKIYYTKLDNGLEVYFIPNKKRKNYYAEVLCKYGSEIEEFKPLSSDNYQRIPYGSAHYLEHKLFDSEDMDTFNFFTTDGTYINAGTSYLSTRYYISGKKRFKRCFVRFLNMIFTPFITDETVTKERGIIEQEISMYDDEPAWKLDYASKKALYHEVFVHDIAGSKESIQEIDAKLLNQIYDVFYQPSNLVLLVSGNINYKEVLDILKNNKALNSRITNQKIVYKEKMEPRIIHDEYKVLYSDIVIPKLTYSFKWDLNDFTLSDKILLRTYLDLLFSIIFVDGGSFDNNIRDKSLGVFYAIGHDCFKNIYTFTIEAESDYADLFKEEVDNAFKNIKISEEEFIRSKKMWLVSLVRSIDHSDYIVNVIVQNLIKDNYYYDEYEILKKLTYQEFISIIKEIDFSNKSFVLMLPKDKEKE